MREVPAFPRLKFDDWPEPDRKAWTGMFATGDNFEGSGRAVHWAAATRRTNLAHYATWLGWCARTGRLDPDLLPAARATQATVTAYARARTAVNAPRTVASALIGLKVVLKAMDPARDWRWLMDMTNRLDAWALPSRDHRARILPASQVFDGALAELDRLAQAGFDHRTAQIACRDTLVVALLVACPLRLRNLQALELGRHLCRCGSRWQIVIPAAETKTRQPLRYEIPATLDPALERYLAEVRPRFPSANGSSHLWPGCKRRPMAANTIYQSVRRTTRQLFGVAIDPHSFRSIAASFLAMSSPSDALRAGPLLGHRNLATTATHYVKANQLDASRKIADALHGMRDTKSARKVP